MRIKWREWLFTIFAFIFFFYLYSLFSYLGLQDFIEDGVLKEYFNSNAWHLEIIITSILFGTLFILINKWTEKKIFRKRSFGYNIILRTALYIIALIIVGVIIFNSFLYFGLLDNELLKNIKNNFLSIELISSFVIYWILIVILINFLISISQKFGSKTFIDLLTGKYYHPKSEELVFLFLDLKGSTRIAEKLDHKNYSRFIKECIHELTPVVQKYKARIYQYVGDEVVLFWTINDGLKQLNCINLFFDFIKILSQRQDYFNEKYGEIPQFKAGMASGIVTLTEIGDIKREIAFHGDVLNTAARLEKKCNEFNEKLIVSQHVVDNISSNYEYSFKFLSDLALKGKSENIRFYSVNIR